MSALTALRLRLLFEQMRPEYTSDEETWLAMQEMMPPDRSFNRFSTDSLWAMSHGADSTELDERLNYFGGSFVQTVRTSDGQYMSFRLELEGGQNLLDLLTTPEGQESRRRTIQRILEKRYGFKGGGFQLHSSKALNRFNPARKERVILPEDYEDDLDDDFEDEEDFEDNEF